MHEIFEKIKSRNPNEPEFLQAVDEVLQSVGPVLEKHSTFRNLNCSKG